MARQSRSIPNIGIAGFLMKKTAQPFSLRQTSSSSASDFKDTNMLLYINKKLADVRQRLGTNHIPFDFLSNPCLRIKPQKKSLEEQRKDVYDVLEKEIKIHKELYIKRERIKERSKSEDYSENSKTPIKKLQIPAGQKISHLLHTLLKEEDLLAIYYQYKLKKRKTNGIKENVIHSDSKNEKLKQEFMRSMDEFEDHKLINELSNQSQIDLPKMLGLEKELIKDFIYEKIDDNELEKMKKIEEAKKLRSKNARLSSQDINNLMSKDDRKNFSRSVESFNSTRLENMSLEKKTKRRMPTSQVFFFKLREKNEQMDEKMFQEHLSDVHNTIRQHSNKGQEKFIRNKREMNGTFNNKSFRKSMSFLESPVLPKTHRKEKQKMNDFINDCKVKIDNEKKETRHIEQNLKEMGNLLDGVSENMKQRSLQLNHDDKFKEFLDQRDFKKKFLNHFIEKIIDPQNILSHYKKKFTK